MGNLENLDALQYCDVDENQINMKGDFFIKLTYSFLLIIYIGIILFWIIRRAWEIQKLEIYYQKRSLEQLHQFDSYRRYNQIKNNMKLSTSSYADYIPGLAPNYSYHTIDERENATILMLCRNQELQGVLKSMRSLEDRFNKKYNYVWTFLNDVPFDSIFIESTTAMASGYTQYGLIPKDSWDKPNWINDTIFETNLKLMQDQDVLYGGSKSYRNMCRFNSGFFFRHKLLEEYDYYFRVEPDVEYHCDFPYDPFKIMKEKKKKYGFVIAIYEYENTIPTLWNTVKHFIQDNQDIIDMETNSYNFITDSSIIGQFPPVIDSNTDYNLCHFWSNFEIGDLNFFRSEEYIRFFNFLDETGGFYYERWGDAPVHSIAVSLLLNRDEIMHFDELGYYHLPFGTCPYSYWTRLTQRCVCDISEENNISIRIHSCLMRWWKNGGGKLFMR